MAENKINQELAYTGKVQPEPGEIDNSGRLLYPYLPSEELIEQFS
jgi:hypothetical protein